MSMCRSQWFTEFKKSNQLPSQHRYTTELHVDLYIANKYSFVPVNDSQHTCEVGGNSLVDGPTQVYYADVVFDQQQTNVKLTNLSLFLGPIVGYEDYAFPVFLLF